MVKSLMKINKAIFSKWFVTVIIIEKIKIFKNISLRI